MRDNKFKENLADYNRRCMEDVRTTYTSAKYATKDLRPADIRQCIYNIDNLERESIDTSEKIECITVLTKLSTWAKRGELRAQILQHLQTWFEDNKENKEIIPTLIDCAKIVVSVNKPSLARPFIDFIDNTEFCYDLSSHPTPRLK